MPLREQPSHDSADEAETSRRQRKAENLDNSSLFDVHRWSEYGEVNELVDHVWELPLLRNPGERPTRIDRPVKTIIAA